MYTLSSILLVLLGCTIALADNLCDTSTSDRFSEYGTDHPICLLYNNTQKMVFYPKVDEFTLLEADGSFAEFGNVLNEGLVVQVEVGGHSTDRKRYHTSTSTVAFYTVIIELDEGRVDDVYWDTSCTGCSDSLCIDGFCSIENSDCGEFNCDIQVYIGWLGTDSDGRHMISSGQRYGAFTKYSSSELYDNILDASKD